MTEYETFMVYELDDSGEYNRLSIAEEELQSNLHPEQVLVIVREDLRRIFIWKGPKSPVRKRFISSRVAQELQENLRNDARFHRCKIVSVDAGDEPTEFLNAFKLESMEVTERLADMRYVRNIDREKMNEAIIKDVIPMTAETNEEEYFSPALKDTTNNVVTSSIPSSTPKSTNLPKARLRTQYPTEPMAKTPGGLSKEEQEKIKDKILKTEIYNGHKRLNLILGHTLLAAVSKTAKVFGDEVEETEWEPVKKVPKDMIELDNHIIRVYFNETKGIVEAVEILEKEGEPNGKPKKSITAKTTTSSSSLTPMPEKPTSMSKSSAKPSVPKKVDFNTMTVKDLKAYAEENKITLPATARKAEIIEILEKTSGNKLNNRRQLPKIPSKDD
ncbi:MAG: Rho termination factor N-terminal domain-containing protein [Promethearchaeota archaeon]